MVSGKAFLHRIPLLQIPCALIVERRGGRAMFSTILVAWGLCAVIVGLVKA